MSKYFTRKLIFVIFYISTGSSVLFEVSLAIFAWTLLQLHVRSKTSLTKDQMYAMDLYLLEPILMM